MGRMTSEQAAMLAVAISGVLWGIYWMPLRALDAASIAGVWAIVIFYLLPAVLLAPVMVWRWRALLFGGWSLHVGGLFAGCALVLYSGALVFTDVVRALMFYYLTPVWSTVLARIVIGEAITRTRWATIALALVGLLLILRVDTGIDGSLRAGDWMGIASGIVWAVASVWIKSDSRGNGLDLALSYFVWGSVAALLLTLLPLEGAKAAPDWETVQAVLPWLVPVVVVLVIPPAVAMMWGASVLSPGLVAILFMTEISAGTITASIWANEPFGLREVAGVILITAAGALEPLLSLRRGKE